MKKITSVILAIMIAAFCLSAFTAFALQPYSGSAACSAIKGATKTTDKINGNKDLEYIHFAADTAYEGIPTMSKSGMSVSTTGKPYMKLTYRTSMAADTLFSADVWDSTGNLLQTISFRNIAKDTWECVAFELPSGYTVITIDLLPFGETNASELEGQYFDLLHIAFCSSLDNTFGWRGGVVESKRLDGVLYNEAIFDLTPAGGEKKYTFAPVGVAVSFPEVTVPEGKILAGWSLNGKTYTEFTMVDEVCTFTPVFDYDKSIKYTVTAGTEDEAKGNASGSGEYSIGDTATVTASPASGYGFTGWYNGDTLVSSEKAYSFTVEGAVTLEARFASLVTEVYISDTGADTNDGASADTPMLTPEAAVAKLTGETGTVYVVGNLTLPTILADGDIIVPSKEGCLITIEGYGEGANIKFVQETTLTGDVIFKNINLEKTATAEAGLVTLGHNLTFGEGVTTSVNNGRNDRPWTVASSQGRKKVIIPLDNTHIMLTSGTIKEAYSGGFINTTTKGTSKVTVSGAVVDVVGVFKYNIPGNNALEDAVYGTYEHEINGGVVKKLWGGGSQYNTMAGLVKNVVNGGTVNTVYTLGVIEGQCGVVVTEINGGRITSIEAPADAANSDTTRIVILNNGIDMTVADSKAVVVKSTADGKVEAVTTVPTEANSFACTLTGVKITTDKPYVVVKDANGEKVYDVANGEEVTLSAEGELVLPITATGTYEISYLDTISDTVTVSFVNGGNTVKSETLEVGATIVAPEAPAAPEGHSFDGWYNGDEKFAEGATASKDVTYTAVFSKNKYTVAATASPENGGSVSGPGEYEYGATATLKATANEGFEFVGWYDGDNKLSDEAILEITVLESKTYVAKLEAISYTVTINGADSEYAAGDEITLPAAPEVRDGFSFRWYDETNGTYYAEGARYTVSGNATIIPVYTATGARYILDGTYNGNADKYTVSMYLYGVKANTGAFGFKYDTSVMTLDGFEHEYANVDGSVPGFAVNDAENGIIRGIWAATDSPEGLSYVDATAQNVLIGTFTFTMADHSAFDKATDFVEYSDDTSYAQAYENGKYLVSTGSELQVDFEPVLSEALTETVMTEYKVTLGAKTLREEGKKPYANIAGADGKIYSGNASLEVFFDDESVAKVYEDKDCDTSIIPFELSLVNGDYTYVIRKNGYISYSGEFTVADGDVDAGTVTLIGGDIKANYDDECGNGSVELDDFVRIIRAFDDGSTEIHHAVTDINEDGAVNVTDIAIIKASFGKNTDSYNG